MVQNLWSEDITFPNHLIQSCLWVASRVALYPGESLAAVALVVLTCLLYSPPNIVKDLSRKEKRNVNKSHKDLPPIYPNGWIPITESVVVTKDKIYKGKVFVNEIVIFRGSENKIYAVDAYCCHLGAHFGFGGQVVTENNDDCIKCPFHGWTYRGSDGLCVKVPYTKNQCSPPGVKLKTWPVLDINGFIYIWYHAEGLEPQWYPKKIEQIESNEWQFGGRTEHIVNCHFQEIPENGADVGHLQAIHADSVFLGGDLDSINRHQFMSSITSHNWEAVWSPATSPDDHMALLTLRVTTLLLGFPIFCMNLSVTQIGPAIVNLIFEIPLPLFGGFRGVYVQALTPLAPNEQRIVHHLYMKQSLLGRIVSKCLLHGQSMMLDRDILMWNNKKFLKKPVLVKEDKSLAKFRNWYSQFYSENSPRFVTPVASYLDW